MAELHHAQALLLAARRCHHPVPAHRDQAIAEALQHDAGVEDHPPFRRQGIEPFAFHLHLQARPAGPGQGRDQVDVTVGFGPDVATIRCLGHGWIADRPGEGGGIAGHLVKEGFGAAQAQGNDPQEAAL